MFTDLFHGYIDMAGILLKAVDANHPRAPDHTSVLGSMYVHQILRTCQCLNDFRVRIYNLGTCTLTAWPLNM